MPQSNVLSHPTASRRTLTLKGAARQTPEAKIPSQPKAPNPKLKPGARWSEGSNERP
jgi:hypothetical protein